MSNIIFLPPFERRTSRKQVPHNHESAKIYLFGGIRYEFIDEPTDGPQQIKPSKRKAAVKPRSRTRSTRNPSKRRAK